MVCFLYEDLIVKFYLIYIYYWFVLCLLFFKVYEVMKFVAFDVVRKSIVEWVENDDFCDCLNVFFEKINDFEDFFFFVKI